MGLFSKDNASKFNDELEKILEHKKFSNDTKNLLLSMLYKIENSFADYSKVKLETEDKETYIKRLLSIVDEECEELVTVTPGTDDSKCLKEIKKSYIIDAPKGKILVYANEIDILYALNLLDVQYNQYKETKDYDFKKMPEEKEYVFNSIRDFIAKGEAMNKAELIRDFNGWSWNTDPLGMDNIEYNLIYQDMIMLLGKDIVNQYLLPKKESKEVLNLETNAEDLRTINNNPDMEAEKNIEYKINKYFDTIDAAFNKLYFKEKVEDIAKYMKIMILSSYLKNNEKIRIEVRKIADYKKERIELMKDNVQFLNVITQEKKDLNKKIESVDKIINDSTLLRKEYELRNDRLADKDKIFSVSHLEKQLEDERNSLLNQIRERNKILEPKCYIMKKEEYLEEYKFFNAALNACTNVQAEDLLMKIQTEFLKCFKIQVEQADNKAQLINLIFKFRYFCLLPINELQTTNEIKELQHGITEIINMLIDKCIDKKVMENISNSVSLCYNILKYIFESKVIDLENVYLKVVKDREEIIDKEKQIKKYYITINLFDSKEETAKFNNEVNNLLLLNIKLNRKIALFI